LALFTTAPGAEGVTPDDYAALVIQPVQAESTAFQVATQLSTTSTRMHLPIVMEDAGAAWIGEGDEIPNHVYGPYLLMVAAAGRGRAISTWLESLGFYVPLEQVHQWAAFLPALQDDHGHTLDNMPDD
jgi:hypothetical protein